MPYLREATDAAFGAMPYDVTISVGRYRKDALAARVYPGDFVLLEADGFLAPAAAGSTNLLGVAAEASAGSTADEEVLVYDDPSQLFVIQEDSDTSFCSQTQIGLNYNLVAGAGDTLTDRSRHELDISSGTTTGAPLRLLRIHELEGVDGTEVATAAGQWRKVVVQINWANHQRGTAAGI